VPKVKKQNKNRTLFKILRLKNNYAK